MKCDNMPRNGGSVLVASRPVWDA